MFSNIIDYNLINEQYLEAFLAVHGSIKDLGDIEQEVIHAVRDKMNRIDWLTEKDATKKLIQTVYKVFAKYARNHGYRVSFDVGHDGDDELKCRFHVEPATCLFHTTLSSGESDDV